MNPAELTTLVTAIGAVVAAFTVPVYLDRRKEKHVQAAVAARNARRVAETSEVTWEGINLAIARERDKAVAELAAQQAAHSAALQAMRDEMVREAAALKERHDTETASLKARIEYCQSEITRLHQELYDANRLRQPPPPPP